MNLNEITNKTNLAGSELKNYRRKMKILDLLYHHGTLSATSIGKSIGVSLPTAISLLKELGANEYVEVRGSGESQGGRKPTMFGLKSDSILVVACELGRFQGRLGIYDAHNRLVAPVSVFEATIDDTDLDTKIHDCAQQIIKKHKIDQERILGIGLAMPGLIDETNGINHTIKSKSFRNVRQRLEEKFGKMVYLNNDARMQAYGEFVFGQAKGHDNALILNWNWGLGLGMILDGKLYNGSTGFAGELSHIKFVEEGELCFCGKRGCLETVTSVYVLLEKARNAIESGKISQLTGQFKDRTDELKVEDILKAARSGDEFCISLLSSVGQALGQALANTIQLLNPDVIVLGGVVSGAGKFVLGPIQQSINKYCLDQISGNTKIRISKNWEQSGMLGITAMMFRKLFSYVSN